ncbi:MAG: hypothetical protein Q9M31_08710, partial [Mariprofundus sp.]|nr:hypothetical protein [Mariprofundus sp.]
QPIYKTSKAKWEHYQTQLTPMIQGTNGTIEWDPIDMVTLPKAGFLVDGVALYDEEKLDEAEYAFKKLLHHLPEHAAANFMVGLVYARKGHLQDAIGFMEKGFEKCPWNKHWRSDLIQAYQMTGDNEKAEALQGKGDKQAGEIDAGDEMAAGSGMSD